MAGKNESGELVAKAGKRFKMDGGSARWREREGVRGRMGGFCAIREGWTEVGEWGCWFQEGLDLWQGTGTLRGSSNLEGKNYGSYSSAHSPREIN